MDKDVHLAPNGPAKEDTKRKRKLKRKRVAKPDPDPDSNVPGQRVVEIVSTVKCTFSAIAPDPDFWKLLNRFAEAVNAMTVLVSLLAKERLLTKLHREEALPQL
ncbi:MAG: hypothetical protein GY743_11470, partial [Planctomycetaceae bacterium]|nr:hypothetical protein [Planctomycetaceae bacterium]